MRLQLYNLRARSTDTHRRGRRHINGVFADQRLPRTYTLDKLEMWQGNGLYRWRCKQRGQPPPSWEGKGARKAKKRKKRKGGAQPQGRPAKVQSISKPDLVAAANRAQVGVQSKRVLRKEAIPERKPPR